MRVSSPINFRSLAPKAIVFFTPPHPRYQGGLGAFYRLDPQIFKKLVEIWAKSILNTEIDIHKNCKFKEAVKTLKGLFKEETP